MSVIGIHYEANKIYFFVSGKQTNYRSQSEIKKKGNEDIRKVVVNTTRKVKQQSRGKRKRETPKVLQLFTVNVRLPE